MNKTDVIVVGAGISGLSLAHYAKKAGLHVIVLEKESKPGGSFDTFNLPNSENGFWIELGAHTCYNSYGNLIEIMEQCGVIGAIRPRAKVPYRLWIDGKFKSFMGQIGFLELLSSLPKAFGKKKTGETVASYYGSILGKRNFEKVFSALFSAVPSQKADDFPADALFKKRDRRKDILKDYTMNNGLQSITDSIVKHNQLEVVCGVQIESITKSNDGFLVKCGAGEYSGKHLAICTPVGVAPKLISASFPDVAGKISQLKYQTIESLGVIVPKESLTQKPFAGLVPINDDFFSIVSRDTVPDDRFRGFTFHFKPGVLTWRQKTEKVCNILGIDTGQIVEMREKSNVVPSLRLGHNELVHEIDRLLQGTGLYISGNYFAGLSIEDCVIRSKTEVERMAKG
ncbi:MAG: FAD-dependent oxidoreductase [Cyclobacteriaceae bacterium]|nr:FAD-dependent oxidoreductase [Cyclobacteriaceae bacterium]